MPQKISSRCCVVNVGPAGLMLAYLLARSGVEVVVLEKYADFLRDLRGDTVHPSTMQVMHELGLLEKFLALPHDKARTLKAMIGNAKPKIADLKFVPTRCEFIAMMPQLNFLNFLRDHAAMNNRNRCGSCDRRRRKAFQNTGSGRSGVARPPGLSI